ncbi:MAG: hypothetical protein D3905_05830 [Candidatus Electrothrix sp. AS4_5]|nr:hypothetical protein [Candidatus Electrothrix gigas]
MSKKILFFLITITVLLSAHTAYSLSVGLNKTNVKWGEPVTVRVVVKNPHNKTIPGGITVSFSGNLIVTDHDAEGKLYWEGNKFQYRSGMGHACCIKNKNIVVENWYQKWKAYEKKTMTVSFFPLRTGVLEIYTRAAFIQKNNPSLVLNIPEKSPVHDQQNYPVQVKHLAVAQSNNFIRTFQAIIDNSAVGDSSSFRNSLQRLINNPQDTEALNFFGIQGIKNSPDYLVHLQSLIKNPRIAHSPDLMYYLERLINDPMDRSALSFFNIEVVKDISPPQKNYAEELHKAAINFLYQQTGGSTLVQLIEAEQDIRFTTHNSKYLGIGRQGRQYVFNKQDTDIVLTIARKIKETIKPSSPYIYQPEAFSSASYTQLINTLSKKELYYAK